MPLPRSVVRHRGRVYPAQALPPASVPDVPASSDPTPQVASTAPASAGEPPADNAPRAATVTRRRPPKARDADDSPPPG